MLTTSKKLIVSGDSVELFDYEVPIDIKGQNTWRSKSNPAVNLRRLIASNLKAWRDSSHKGSALEPIFFTLTFREQAISEVDARLAFKLFLRRFGLLRHSIDGVSNKYVAVMELTKRGVPHFHMLIFNLPYLSGLHEVLTTSWSNGYTLFRSVDHGEYVGRYLAKELSKQMKNNIADASSENSRKHFTNYYRSRGLNDSKVILGDVYVDGLLSEIQAQKHDVVSSYRYMTFRTGWVQYTSFLVDMQSVYNSLMLALDN